jgi:asparagine synthase (glutamine-hydrolysing)
MYAPGRQVGVVYNGEIYNYLDLKKELSDYPYQGTCDTEVILAGYLRWGIDFVRHIQGMFAIALFDFEKKTLYLVRDRIGKKPLYFQWEDGNLIFGSELKPIMRSPGFQGRIRRDVLARYLFQQYILEPDTIFENVYQLEPGTCMEVHAGKARKWKYWDVRETYERESREPVRDYQEAKAELKKRLQKAVADRMIADVPLGTFLSGGYDSSLVTAIAQEHSDTPVKTFSIGFSEKKYDESTYAAEVAKTLGTDHTSLVIDEKTMLDQVSDLAKYYDEPFADSSQIPMMLVAELARTKVTVALSGDGGDEFFAGYNIYAQQKQAQALDGIGALVYGIGQIPAGKGKKLLDRMDFRVRTIAGNRDPETKVQMCSEAYIRSAHAFLDGKERGDARMRAVDYLAGEDFLSERAALRRPLSDLPCRYPVESTYPVRDWQVRRMLLDMDTYLPGDILRKVDWATMKYSLEARCPILDTKVMEYSYRIPQKFKYYHGDKKHILKDIAYDYLPREILDRPKKGFSVPLDSWLRGPLRDTLERYAGEQYLKEQGIFDASYVHRFVQHYLETGDGGDHTGANFSGITWSFFVFQQWYEQYKEVIAS